MTATDLAELSATLEHNREARQVQDAASAAEIEALLQSARSNLEAARAIRAESDATNPSYDELRQSLDRVRQIVKDLREGNY